MKREGFTLIELLMVIVVIALLMALLIPVLQRSRQQTRNIVCRSKLKQLVYKMTMYHDDENGKFPNALNYSSYASLNLPPGGHAGDVGKDRPGWWWFNYVTDYSTKDFSQKKVIWCPSRNIIDRKLKRNVLCANYGVNQSICKSTSGQRRQTEFTGKPLGMSDIQRDSETLLVFDCGYSMIKWWHVANIPPETSLGIFGEDFAYIPGLKINEEKEKRRGLEWDAIYGRHPKKTVNVGFVDGHVDVKEADDLLIEKTGTDYKNLFPLWRPTRTCDN